MTGDMNILVVEDNDVDVEILKRGLRRTGNTGTLLRARDGLEALELLQRDLSEPTVPRHCIILLDINMPRMDGHEFLRRLRASEDLKAARVFVFTTSDSSRDVTLAYRHHATGYVVKPGSASELTEVLKTLQDFWALCKAPDVG